MKTASFSKHPALATETRAITTLSAKGAAHFSPARKGWVKAELEPRALKAQLIEATTQTMAVTYKNTRTACKTYHHNNAT